MTFSPFAAAFLRFQASALFAGKFFTAVSFSAKQRKTPFAFVQRFGQIFNKFLIGLAFSGTEIRLIFRKTAPMLSENVPETPHFDAFGVTRILKT